MAGKSIQYQERSTLIEEPITIHGEHQHNTIYRTTCNIRNHRVYYTYTYKGAHNMQKRNIIGTIIRIITNIAVAMTLAILFIASFNGNLQNIKEWIGTMNYIVLLIVVVILGWRLGTAGATFVARLLLYTSIRTNKVWMEQQVIQSKNEEEAVLFKKLLDEYSQGGIASVLRSLCEATANGILLFFLL